MKLISFTILRSCASAHGFLYSPLNTTRSPWRFPATNSLSCEENNIYTKKEDTRHHENINLNFINMELNFPYTSPIKLIHWATWNSYTHTYTYNYPLICMVSSLYGFHFYTVLTLNSRIIFKKTTWKKVLFFIQENCMKISVWMMYISSLLYFRNYFNL